MEYKPLSAREEEIARAIVDAAFVDKINAIWTAQLLSHLKLTGKRLGFIINFNVPIIKNGIKRLVI